MDSHHLNQLLRAPVIKKRNPPILLNYNDTFSIETQICTNTGISNDLDLSWSDLNENSISLSLSVDKIQQVVSTKWRSQCEFDSYKNSIETNTVGSVSILEMITLFKSSIHSTFQKRVNLK